MPNFVVLIGGPGKFMGCDKAHDQSWTNYVVPMQLAGLGNLYGKTAAERVCWVVYEPAYRSRWLDDSVIEAEEKKQDDGYWLHTIRKRAADEVASRGSTDYLHRIRTIAGSVGATYKGISRPEDFWKHLLSYPRRSVSRVWYCGHASGDGLMLALTHNSSCQAAARVGDMIQYKDISAHSSLADRFATPATKASKFYGCYTSRFAEKWHEVFGVPAEGAVNKIDLGSVDRASAIPNVLDRIEQTPTSFGSPDWKVFK